MINRETARTLLQSMIIEEFVKRGLTLKEAEKYLAKMVASGEIGRRTDLAFNEFGAQNKVASN